MDVCVRVWCYELEVRGHTASACARCAVWCIAVHCTCTTGVHLYMCIRTCASLYTVHVHLYNRCASVHVHLYNRCASVHVHLYMYLLCICTCASVHVHLYMCICQQVCICTAGVHLYMCICTCACCAHACTCCAVWCIMWVMRLKVVAS